MWSKRLFLPLSAVKEENSLTAGSVTDVCDFWEIWDYPLARMIHAGGSMIPHLQDNQQYQQYISFPPCPCGLTVDKAKKLAAEGRQDDGRAGGLSARLTSKPC